MATNPPKGDGQRKGIVRNRYPWCPGFGLWNLTGCFGDFHRQP